MVIYGVALLSFCMLVGMYLGDILGNFIGVQANVGGVGIAMLLLIVLANLNRQDFQIGAVTEKGIHFWSAMYIPIVVAMAAKQRWPPWPPWWMQGLARACAEPPFAI